MPPQCSRCKEFMSEEDKVILDLEDFHKKCAIEKLLEQLPEVTERKKEAIRERVQKASRIQFSRRRGLEVIE